MWNFGRGIEIQERLPGRNGGSRRGRDQGRGSPASGAESRALGADQCSGPGDLLSASCSTAAVIRRQVSAPS
jgi:hypothetical protein